MTIANNDPCPVAMRGIVPSLNTPFTADGAVDLPAMARLAEATIAAGCRGVLGIAVAGEQASLSTGEKDAIVRTLVEVVAGRIPVIASVTSDEAGESLRLATMARRAGADGICCQTPGGIGGAALTEYFKRIAEAGPDLLMIQDLDWEGPGLGLADIERLFRDVLSFQCLKIETAPAGPKYSAVLDATGGALHVSGGWAVREMIDALERGVHAVMPTAMDAHYVAIHDAFRAGDRDRAKHLFETVRPILDFSNQHIDISIRVFKMMRHAEGLFASDHCRAPVRPLSPEDLRRAEDLVAYAGRMLER